MAVGFIGFGINGHRAAFDPGKHTVLVDHSLACTRFHAPGNVRFRFPARRQHCFELERFAASHLCAAGNALHIHRYRHILARVHGRFRRFERIHNAIAGINIPTR